MNSIRLKATGEKVSGVPESTANSLEGLRQAALASVRQKTICGILNRSMRILEAIKVCINHTIKW